MAGVTCRRRGTYWEYRFDMATVDGKRKQHSKSGFRTKTEAMKAGNAALAKYNRGGELVEPSGMSLADWVDRWLETSVRIRCAESTYAGYKRIMKGVILPLLGKYRLASLSRQVLADFVSGLCGHGYSRKTVQFTVSILSASLSSAVRLGVIDSFHRECLAIPRSYAKTANKREAVTPEQFQILLKEIPEAYKPCVVIGWMTGMRAGEILSLRWSDVDFKADTISIARRVYHGRLAAPKDGSARVIRMGGALHAYLFQLRQRQMENEVRYGYYYRVGMPGAAVVARYKGEVKEKDVYRLVAAKEGGSPIEYSSLERAVRLASRKTGVACDMHTLRHSHATLLLEAGVPPKAVQQRLGHKTIRVTMEIYAHVTERMQDRLVDTIDHSPAFSWTECGQKAKKDG